MTPSVFGGAAAQLIWNTEPGLLLLIKTGSASIINGPNGLPEELITSGGTRYYYHQDQIGSTLSLSDSTGTQVQSYAYDPYGNLTSSTGAISNPFQFQGQYLESVSSLYYMRARWFDPLSSQFTTVDPIAALTRACYGFTGGSPVNRVDPAGTNWSEGVDKAGNYVFFYIDPRTGNYNIYIRSNVGDIEGAVGNIVIPGVLFSHNLVSARNTLASNAINISGHIDIPPGTHTCGMEVIVIVTTGVIVAGGYAEVSNGPGIEPDAGQTGLGRAF